MALLSLALLAGGGTLVWAHTTRRDDDGYYTTRHETFLTGGYALRSDDLDLGTEGSDWLFDEGRLATIRLQGRSAEPGKRLFFGIGPAADVERYLEGVESDIVVDLEVDPFEAEADTSQAVGPPRPSHSRSGQGASMASSGTSTKGAGWRS